MTGQMTIFDYLRPDGDLETALLTGSLFRGGKLRIYELYQQEPDRKKRVDFLKQEYGSGGRSVDFSHDRRGFINFSKQNVEVWYFGREDRTKYTWQQAEKCIKRLIDTGMYMTMDDMDEWAELSLEYPDGIPYPKPCFGWPNREDREG